jgi:plastocyanin
MDRRSLHTLALAAGVALIGLGTEGAESAPPHAVGVQLFQFRPGRAEVGKGTAVTWTNQDDVTHTVTSGTPEQRDGRFDAQLAGSGATATVEFKEPGVYPYFCDRHPSMRGEIRVNYDQSTSAREAKP